MLINHVAGKAQVSSVKKSRLKQSHWQSKFIIIYSWGFRQWFKLRCITTRMYECE